MTVAPELGSISPAEASLEALNNWLNGRSYMIGYSFSAADVAVFKNLSDWAQDYSAYPNVARWYRHINSFRGEFDAPEDKKETSAFGVLYKEEAAKDEKSPFVHLAELEPFEDDNETNTVRFSDAEEAVKNEKIPTVHLAELNTFDGDNETNMFRFSVGEADVKDENVSAGHLPKYEEEENTTTPTNSLIEMEVLFWGGMRSLNFITGAFYALTRKSKVAYNRPDIVEWRYDGSKSLQTSLIIRDTFSLDGLLEVIEEFRFVQSANILSRRKVEWEF